MSFLTDDRAQALQIGAVLLFGLLIILFTFWQAFVVPDQNEEVEFNHNQDVQQQMTEVRSTIVSMPGQETPQSATVALGVRYPSRLLFANPNPSSGILETNNTLNPTVSLELENATAVEGESPGVADFWNGSNKSYNTGSFEYTPDYAILQDAPTTVYEHTILYNEFDRLDDTIAVTDQALVDGNRLNVIALDGEFDESRTGRVSVDVNPVSTQARTVTVKPKNPNSPISFELPTRLEDNQWNQTLDGESARVIENGQNNTVRIELTGNQYELQMAKTSIGTGATQPGPAYVTGVSGVGVDGQGVIPTDENRTLTVEVRDTYNSPVRDIELNSETNVSGLDVRPASAETGANGQITFEIDPTDIDEATLGDNETASVNISADTPSEFESSAGANLTVNVTLDPTLSEEPAFDVKWDIDAMNSTDEFECDNSTRQCNISSGRTGTMSVNVTGARSGQLRFAVVNTAAGTVSQTTKSFTGQGATVDFQTESLGPDQTENTTVFVFGGGDSAQMTVNVSSALPDDIVHQYDASQDLDNRGSGEYIKIPDQTSNAGRLLEDNTGNHKIKLTNSGFNGKASYSTQGPTSRFRYQGQTISEPWTMIAVVEASGSNDLPKPIYDHGGGTYSGGSGGLYLGTGMPPDGEEDNTLATDAGENVELNGQNLFGSGGALVTATGDESNESRLSFRQPAFTNSTADTQVEDFGAGSPLYFFQDTNGNEFATDIGEIVIFNSEYDEEIQEYEKLLIEKWGITP